MSLWHLIKRAVCAGAIIFLQLNSANAQFTFSPSTILIKTQVLDTMTYDSLRINNISSSKISLNWQLISYDTTGGSYFDFCASGNCYIGIPDTGSFPDIDTTQFGYIGAHFWTGSIAASCTTKVRVFDENNPGLSDTITFILNAGINGVENHQNPKNPVAYPNPSGGKFHITNIKNQINSVSVFDNHGLKLFSTQNPTNQVDLTSYPTGIYYLEFSTSDGYACQQVIVQK